jgi:hypothetical protein
MTEARLATSENEPQYWGFETEKEWHKKIKP